MFSHRIKLFALFGFQVWIDVSWLLVGGLMIGMFLRTAASAAYQQTMPIRRPLAGRRAAG
jgi:hypothetical protein